MCGGFRFSLLALCVALTGVGCTRSDDAAAEAPRTGSALVFAVTLGGPPYSYADPVTGEPVGIDVELARETAARLGRPLEIRVMDFPELLPAVKSGAADFAGAAITITPNRARDVDFTVPYAFDGSAFLYRATEPRMTIPRSLFARIGTQTASMSLFYLCRHGVDPVLYPTFEAAFEDFEKGKLDAVFYDAEPIRHAAEASQGKYLASPLETREYYGLAIRKDLPNVKAAANDAIAARGGVK